MGPSSPPPQGILLFPYVAAVWNSVSQRHLRGTPSPFTVSVAYLKKQSSEVFHVSTKKKKKNKAAISLEQIIKNPVPRELRVQGKALAC